MVAACLKYSFRAQDVSKYPPYAVALLHKAILIGKSPSASRILTGPWEFCKWLSSPEDLEGLLDQQTCV
jgi:hypothetical protein